MSEDEVPQFLDKLARVVVCGNVMTPYVGRLKWWEEPKTVELQPVAALTSSPAGYRNGSGIILITDISDIAPLDE